MAIWSSVTLRVVECTCQDSRGWWSGFDPLGPSWHRHRPAPELHPGRWALGRQHPRPGLLCTNLFTTCHMSKPLHSKCSVHRKFEAIISYLLLSVFSPNSTYKSEIWRWSVVAGTNDNECLSKPVHVALQVLICPFVAGNEQGHQYSFNKSSRSFVIGLEATSLTWLEPNSTTDGQICRVSSATGSIWLLILSTNQHSIWCVQVLWADKVLLMTTSGDPRQRQKHVTKWI